MDTEDEENVVTIMLSAAINIINKRRKRRRRHRVIWANDWLLKREEKGAFNNLVQEIREENPSKFRNFLRLNLSEFNELASLVCPKILKKSTNMRNPISPEERLAVTLRFLASGNSYQDLEYLYRISVSALSEIIPETCAAIKESLESEYMKCPTSSEEWLDIETGFTEKWNFCHCIGAIDGKHVRIKKPNGSGSTFYNYKNYFSIVLLAVVDADYKFQYVDIGKNGRESDRGIYKNSTFNVAYEAKALNLPLPKLIPNTGKIFPYVFVGDDAFKLEENMMKPYGGKTVSQHQRIFNYRLSRARRIVENAFGILANRFRVFHTSIALAPEKVELIIWACCNLHNFLRSKKSTQYMPRGSVDEEDELTGRIIDGNWRGNDQLDNIGPQGSNMYSRRASDIRDSFKDYFNSAQGRVEWQDRMV